MIVKLAQILPAFKGEKSRVWCFLHIVNLIAKAIIRQFDASKGGLEVEEDEGKMRVAMRLMRLMMMTMTMVMTMAMTTMRRWSPYNLSESCSTKCVLRHIFLLMSADISLQGLSNFILGQELLDTCPTRVVQHSGSPQTHS